jgi:negative regulator of flagellin synthesis FlgM
MNVNNDLQGLQQLFPSQGVEQTQTGRQGSAAAQTAGSAADQATLSTAASVAAQAAPDSDVRMDKVTQVQQALAAGTYNVPASAVADKMIGQMLAKG